MKKLREKYYLILNFKSKKYKIIKIRTKMLYFFKKIESEIQ